MCESDHHGYANRETWATQLWLTNDYDMYLAARERAIPGTVHDAAAALQEWLEQELWWELAETPDGRNVIYDVGSLWRVDWEQVAGALRD